MWSANAGYLYCLLSCLCFYGGLPAHAFLYIASCYTVAITEYEGDATSSKRCDPRGGRNSSIPPSNNTALLSHAQATCQLKGCHGKQKCITASSTRLRYRSTLHLEFSTSSIFLYFSAVRVSDFSTDRGTGYETLHSAVTVVHSSSMFEDINGTSGRPVAEK